MLLVAFVNESKRKKASKKQQNLIGFKKLNTVRSYVPAVTHVDYTARIQTVHKDTNPLYYSLIKQFYDLTGCPILVNTSFNVRGEPIVCTPMDAYLCFMRTEMDYLLLNNYLLDKKDQKPLKGDGDWMSEFELD